MNRARAIAWGIGIGLAAACAPGQSPAPVNPVTMLIHLQKDLYRRGDMPDIHSRNSLDFAPAALRFGTGEKDVAFILFDARKKEEKVPDTAYLWIPGHPEFQTPKPYRGKVRKQDNQMGFRDIQFTSEDAGVKRTITLNVIRLPGETGSAALEATVVAEYQGKRTVLTYGEQPTAVVQSSDHDRIRVQTLFEEPRLQLRAAGDGTDVTCSLAMGQEWFLLPREGMDTALSIEVTDAAGKSVFAQKIIGNPETYIGPYSWKVRLKNLKKDERYTVRAHIQMGPWMGELKSDVMTQLIDRRM